MTEERFIPKCNFQKCQFIAHIKDNENQVVLDINDIVDLLNEQQATINNQELRLQQLEEILELSKNLNKKYREKLIDMNLKMVIDDE